MFMFSNITEEIFNDSEFKEDSVREVIITPILQKLGYSPTGTNKIVRSKSLRDPFIKIGTRNLSIQLIPDYTLYHNDKAIFVLDAKSPKEDILDSKHIQQVYSYAIHPEIKAKEFGLCNGKNLAIFNVDSNDPLLYLNFSDFIEKWENIERFFLPRFLLDPLLRNFAPDFGFRLRKLGLTSKDTLHLPGTRLNFFGKIDNNLLTAGTNLTFTDEELCVSFDFNKSLLPKILSGLPNELNKQFAQALSRSPFQASAGLAIEIDIQAHLGEETRGQSEVFVPIIIDNVSKSRFVYKDLPEDKNDYPETVFQLRKAFKVLEQ